MPGDFSRKTFDFKKHYSGVLMQQGRVQLDADWNEQLEIEQYRTFTQTKDVIGPCGVPKKNGGFKIVANKESFTISAGRIYVGGLLCELENAGQPITYFNQPYYPNPDLASFLQDSPPSSPLSLANSNGLLAGTYLIYIEAWQREVNYRDDALLQEKALGEADTTARLQTVWQVKLLKVQDASATCKTNFSNYDSLIQSPTGKLNAQTKNNLDPKEPCVLPPSAGYRSLENQLYRVEVQTGGDRSVATIKWSRDNASVETKISLVNGSTVTVTDMGKDEVLGFAPGQWVEIVDEEATLNGKPYALYQIESVKPDSNKIIFNTSVSQFTNKKALKLRRWDQSGAGALNTGIKMLSSWMDLEDGVQVQFSAGNYRSGDYWLIPARTATGEIEWPPYAIPNVTPIEQAPLGVKRHYCRLALLNVIATPSGNSVDVKDCRPLFPSLTEICAEDICFDNKNCNFPEAKNVQEALDVLCASNDLRTHNKYLHGYGVICGLKIKCSPNRTKVVIEKGNALDCEGDMIQVKNQNGIAYDLVEEAQKKGLLKGGDGKLCLSIAKGANKSVQLNLETFTPESFWDTVLEGTLLKDFYEDCIKNLIDFFKQQFPFPMDDVAPVPVTQRRLTAFLNLAIQLINSSTGPYGYISGTTAKKTDTSTTLSARPSEDELLRKFYYDLKEKLASETFCAMYDNDDPYPEYILDEGLDTIFGPSLKVHTRLRISPSAQFAYTCGKNNRVYVYNVNKKELVQTSKFPAGDDVELQDIAISQDGKMIFAAGLISNKDSVFAQGKLGSNGFITWESPSTRADVKCMSLGILQGQRLVCTVQSKGLFEIKNIGTAAFSFNVLNQFNATGLLNVSSERGQIIAAVSTDTNIDRFNGIMIINSGSNTGAGPIIINLDGEDAVNDIAVFQNSVFVSGNNRNGSRIIGVYDMFGRPFRNEIMLEDNSSVRLALYSPKNQEKGSYLLATLADNLKVVRVQLNSNFLEIDKQFRIPVQPFPTGIVIDSANTNGYVLNAMVNTLTSMDMARVFHNEPAPDYTQEPPYNLAAYRDEAIEAYKDVLSHLLQYLKDCFCDKFLIDCPECGEDDKVYLGCIEVRNSKVYNICNFSKRKYVKSFQTVEYWLSTVPILPMIETAFARICCTVFDQRSNTNIQKQ